MIPVGGTRMDIAAEAVRQPSRTYSLHMQKGRIVGMTDGLDAVKQAVYKILRTERFRHEIYSFAYGHELGSLLGGHPQYVRSEVARMIQEALLQDDRITGIRNMKVQVTGDQLTASFEVATLFGAFRQEVSGVV